MDKSDVVIVGGVACGPKTGAVLARRNPSATITLFQKETRMSYGSCGMPYFASGDINSFAELESTSYGIPRDAAWFEKTRGFKVVAGAEVIAVDRTNKTVTVKDVASGEKFEHGYDKLVLATGATPSAAPFPIPESPCIRPFTRPDDAIAFRRMAEQGKVGRALIVGGGFIGCELAEAAGGLWGIETILVEREPQILPYALDKDMAAIAERELVRQGIDVRTGREIVRIDLLPEDQGLTAVLNDGQSVNADYVFLCLGVRPNVELAKGAGLEIGERGGIVVNDRLQTSDPDIYAGGDCIESWHQITGKSLFLPMGSLANRHGRVISDNLAGNESSFPGVLGTFLVKVFDTNVGAVGLSERAAQDAGLKTNVLWGTFPDRPDYYPEGQTFVLKMVYEPESGRLLGLQAVGAGDICRRVDVFSSFLQRKATVRELLDLEHGYAPPYSEALDPLHHLASMAQAQMRGVQFISSQTDLTADPELVLVDVRQAEEFESESLAEHHGHCPTPLNIPLEELTDRAGELDKSKRIIVSCKRGPRSYIAASVLKRAGFERVEILAGGLQSLL